MADQSPNWPAHLDALIAAPKHHKLLLANEAIRVLESRIEPGETVPLHTHRWPAVYYILATGDFVRRDENGGVLADTRLITPRMEAGQAVWSPPLGPHTLENVGESAIHVISVELKS